MHPFLHQKLEFGKPHPPWKDIWERADKIDELNEWMGKVCDGATGAIYRTAKEYIKAVEHDEPESKIPFAMKIDGKPDYNHALIPSDRMLHCAECDGKGWVLGG